MPSTFQPASLDIRTTPTVLISGRPHHDEISLMCEPAAGGSIEIQLWSDVDQDWFTPEGNSITARDEHTIRAGYRPPVRILPVGAGSRYAFEGKEW